MMNRCPVRGCGTLIRPPLRFCHQCWRMLPEATREWLTELSYYHPDSEAQRDAIRDARSILDALNRRRAM